VQNKLPGGLYDLLFSSELQRSVESNGLNSRVILERLSDEEVKRRVGLVLAKKLHSYFEERLSGGPESWRDKLDDLAQTGDLLEQIQEWLPSTNQVLSEIVRYPQDSPTLERPDIPLSASALLSGSSRSPSLRSQLIKELHNCDRADWLVSFIKYAGLLPLLPALRDFTQSAAEDGGPRLRVATTTYMGATDIKAIEALLELPNTQVRVSYDTKRTRLHAKAYLFHRKTGFGSAYVGSANISKSAHDEGLEWTVKISQYETEHLWRHACATFESHWEDGTEFLPCARSDLAHMRSALQHESGTKKSGESLPFFDLRPFGYQQAILEDIVNERLADKHQHLIVAATGTGKTMIAAFDYRFLCREERKRPRLLFVAHREELLKQARASFRQVLRDGSFGEIMAGGHEPEAYDHLFCTVQSWSSRGLDRLDVAHFEYVVLDEAHHASASSYQRLIAHIKPRVLMGLTATPERSDGADIRSDFGGAFTHEIRLPEAIERALLAPFHYYGIPDLEGVDFSRVGWRSGRYDSGELNRLIEHNRDRAAWVMGQADRYVVDLTQVRALGFCVSVAHAEFMANFCQEQGIEAIALSANSPQELRDRAKRDLESRAVNIIFTVDLYNEGVDIPSVDTILFLRPTESLTVYLQQLGRGLRLHPDKSHVAVLDFIAPQHRRFSYAKRFRALASRWDIAVDKQIGSGFSYVPSGCFVHLERQAKEYVLENIRQASQSLRTNHLIQELSQLQGQQTGRISLGQMLEFFHLEDPDEIYRRGLPHALLEKAKGKEPVLGDWLPDLAKGFRRLLLLDDPSLIEEFRRAVVADGECSTSVLALIHTALWGRRRPGEGELLQAHHFLRSHPGLMEDLGDLFDWLCSHQTPLPKQYFSPSGILCLHAHYTREQVLLALGKGSFEAPFSSREGVLHVSERKVDCFFADIEKSESDFSPTTMYEDYAITDRLFHWQSQSQTSETSSVGQRYIAHEDQGYTPLLFIRERKKLANGLTAPYFFAGPLRYRRHEGSKPISFIWELEHQLPAKVLAWARRGD
jgi:superfamily II DNA or RNA helicase